MSELSAYYAAQSRKLAERRYGEDRRKALRDAIPRRIEDRVGIRPADIRILRSCA